MFMQQKKESGTDSKGFKWEYDYSTQTLTFSRKRRPWLGRQCIRGLDMVCTECPKVIIKDGITGIGNGNFKDCEYLTDVELPDTLIYINEYAFCGCENWNM